MSVATDAGGALISAGEPEARQGATEPFPQRSWRNIADTRLARYAVNAALALVAVASLAYIAVQIAFLRLGPPPITNLSEVVTASNNGAGGAEQRGRAAKGLVVPFDPDRVDPRYLEMLFAFEDRRFYSHFGVDPVGLMRAVRDLFVKQRIVTGGSTLTMQVARLLDNQYKRTASVKMRQIVRAIQLETLLTKREILSLYLALAPFGGRIKGVRAASIQFFGKEPQHLTNSEAALLVALPQAPEARRLDRHAKAARRARDFVLRTVAAAGILSLDDARTAALEPLAAESSNQMPPKPLQKPSIKVASVFAGLTLGLNFIATPAAAAPMQPEPPRPDYFLGSDNKLVLDVRKLLLGPLPDGTVQADRDALWMFYAGRNAPVWVTRSGWTHAATAAIDELKRADDWGLSAADFQVPELPAATESEHLTDKELAAAEVGLSLAILKYARYARGGRIADPATQLSSYLDRKPQLRPPYLVMADVAATGVPDAFLRKQHPQHPQFERLRQQYLARRNAGEDGALTIPKGNQLSPGTTDEQIALVRDRLGVPAYGVDKTYYDDALAEAVKRFQTKRGISPANGTINAKTRRALNDGQNVSQRTLLANMEEWRWMPEDLGETYVWINIPEYLVRVVRNGEVKHEERVVVGTKSTQTPIFSEDIQTIYFHPRWIVPQSIKMNEVYPSLMRGGGYFHRQGMKLVRNGREVNPWKVNWGKSDIRNYDVYQPSGPGNALGQLKFTFPNKHAVYLHDTPSKKLFNSSQRTFSHGCVRVRNPLVLAQVLLDIDKGWSPETVAALVKGKAEENGIQLDKHIPVHITYFTAQVDEDGDVKTEEDIYGHEKRITQALDGKWGQIDKGTDHLAQVELARRLERSSSSRKASRSASSHSSRRTASHASSSKSRSGGGGGGSYSTRVSSSGSSANDVFRRSFGN